MAVGFRLTRAMAFTFVGVAVFSFALGTPHGVFAQETVDQSTADTALDKPPKSDGGVFGGESSFVSDDEPIDIKADELELDQEKQVAVFKGNVDAVQGDLKLKSEELVIYYTQSTEDQPETDEASGGKTNIRQIDATGNVRLATLTETAGGDWAIYDIKEGVITLGGNVTLTRGENILQGAKLIVDVATGNSRLLSATNGSGRVRGLFVPGSDEDEDGEQKDKKNIDVFGRQTDG